MPMRAFPHILYSDHVCVSTNFPKKKVRNLKTKNSFSFYVYLSSDLFLPYVSTYLCPSFYLSYVFSSPSFFVSFSPSLSPSLSLCVSLSLSLSLFHPASLNLSLFSLSPALSFFPSQT